MAPKLGYLLPTRESIMNGRPETGPLLTLAEKAEGMGFDSLWVGDSVLARPRHDPMTLLAAVAARTKKPEIGTAVLLPALRNPVLLAHAVATVDQVSEGRLILGVGIASDVANIRAEFAATGVPFEKRVGRMMEGLRLMKALWTGEPVDWDGRWPVKDGVLGPTPYRAGGPPLWIGGSVPAARERAAKFFDGWFPNGTQPAQFGEQLAEIRQTATAAGRDGSAIVGSLYLTLAIDDDATAAGERLDGYLASYYGARPDVLRKRQICYAGPAAGAAEWLKAFSDAGAGHMVLRFAGGDQDQQMGQIARIRRDLGW